MPKFHLILLIHAHQPIGNFDHVMEDAYQRCYKPFVELLLRRPAARIGLHVSGVLLEWMEEHHPELFASLRQLVSRHQVELIGGGFYEPVLISIPPEDRQEQLRRLADYLEEKFGQRPTGAWLTERVWEPQLPATLAAAGVEYTLVDDNHFLASGFSADDLHGYFICEELGAKVKVFAGLQHLRYTIPFRDVHETIEFLRAAASRAPGGCAVMGDDCEKFGVWPGTHDLCYTRGWLVHFIQAIEAEADWLEMALPGEFIAANPPAGRADLPTSSYREMSEWSLPTPAREKFHQVQKRLDSMPEVRPFLRGGFWRNFFTKYSEANLLHKKMLHVSGRVQQMAASTRRGLPFRKALEQATTHLLRGQCNDAYWHGIFGGLYAPHLRTALWRELIRAEALAEAAEHGRARYEELTKLDFDADGHDELYWVSEVGAALVKPSDGGTVPLLEFRPVAATLVNSIQRRPEAYHSRLAEAVSTPAAAVSIHEQVRVKEAGLERYLCYDRWARNCFRLLVFPPEKTQPDYEALKLEESATLAGGVFAVAKAEVGEIELALEGTAVSSAPGHSIEAKKWFTFERAKEGFRVTCQAGLRLREGELLRARAGLEIVLNLLAPDTEDRYFEAGGEKHRLRLSAAIPASELRAVDEWQNVAVTVQAEGANEFWLAPIETVSESEEGFERIYQGSQILAVWPLELNTAEMQKVSIQLSVARAR